VQLYEEGRPLFQAIAALGVATPRAGFVTAARVAEPRAEPHHTEAAAAAAEAEAREAADAAARARKGDWRRNDFGDSAEAEALLTLRRVSLLNPPAGSSEAAAAAAAGGRRVMPLLKPSLAAPQSAA
jgi:hypothetical protein